MKMKRMIVMSFDFMSIYKPWEKSKCMDNPMVLLILGESK